MTELEELEELRAQLKALTGRIEILEDELLHVEHEAIMKEMWLS